jgi:hypothetical protein
MIFYYGYSLTDNNIFNHLLAYAHILPGTPNALFIEKDGYQIGFLSYPNNPKVNDFTLLNLNVQQNGTDVGNTYASLIIMDKNKKEIVHQIPTGIIYLRICVIHIFLQMKVITHCHY